MNLERLEVLARWLEAGGHKTEEVPVEFDMEEWLCFRDCGTAACIGGTAETLWGNGRLLSNEDAGRLIGLDSDQSWLLFDPSSADMEVDGFRRPSGWPYSLSEIDAAWTARTIRHLMATGEVAWHLTREPAHA